MAGKATKNARADACAVDDSRKKQKSTKAWTQLDRYKRLIKERMTALKIYKPQYAALIDRTARLYVKLDELEKEYDKAGRERSEYEPPTLDEYTESTVYILTHLSKDTVIHRLTGDAPSGTLIAPEWNKNKHAVIEALTKYMSENKLSQGCFYKK